MKTDRIKFATSKSLQEISNNLRIAVSKLRVINITNMNDDPFAATGGKMADIALSITGYPMPIPTPGKYSIEIYVDDLGNTRSVEMVALGNDFAEKMISSSNFYDLGLSKKKRDEIARMIS